MANFDFNEMNDFFEINRKSQFDYKKELNAEQYDAVTTTEGPMLIIAGAGTGKTKTLTNRVMYLIDVCNVLPEQILMLTFTNKAANEMMTRAKHLLDERCGRIKGCTYHGFCAEFLRRYAHLISVDNNFVILDPGDCATALDLLKEKNSLSKEKDFPKGKELADMFSMAINKNYELDFVIENFFPKYNEYISEIILLSHKYAEYKLEKNLFDYDDLIMKTNQILREHNEVARKISDTYKYIMVDEYQDSNLMQLELLTLIRQFENKNICVVGDDFQSIYGFRGSNFKNIMDFPNQFAPCKIVILNRNYRSNQEILDLSNAITTRAKEKYDKQLHGYGYAGRKPYLVRTSDSTQDALFVLYSIEKLRREEGIELNEMAVLSRGSNDSSFLETLLTQKYGKDSYQKFGGLKFMDRKVVKDIFAFLKILINPLDEISWFRILQLYPNIGPVYAKKITEAVLSGGIEELKNPKFLKAKYGKWLPNIYDYMNKITTMEFHEQIDYIINDYYYEVCKASIENMNTTTGMKRAHLAELDEDIELAQALIEMAEGYKSATAYVTDLTLEVPEKETGEKLTISTIHSAKGLEFKVVFILNCVDGSFPHKGYPKSNTSEALKIYAEEQEEERRVFYVAITRAKEYLFLIAPKVMVKYGQAEPSELSPYLLEDNIYKDFCTIIEN